MQVNEQLKANVFLVFFVFLFLFSLRFIKNIPSQSDCVRPAPRDIPPKTRSTPEATLVVDLVSVRSGASGHLAPAVASRVNEQPLSSQPAVAEQVPPP